MILQLIQNVDISSCFISAVHFCILERATKGVKFYCYYVTVCYTLELALCVYFFLCGLFSNYQRDLKKSHR